MAHYVVDPLRDLHQLMGRQRTYSILLREKICSHFQSEFWRGGDASWKSDAFLRDPRSSNRGAVSDSTDVPAEAEGPVTILVVEDQDIVAEALSRALDGESGMDVVGVALSVEAAVRAAAELRPRVIVMDYALPDGNGADAARRIKADFPEIEIVMMTGLTGGGVLAEALEAGCSGFVPKQSHYSMLVSAIRGVLNGQVQVPPDLMTELIAHLRQRPSAQGSELTVRELELLRLIAAGHSTSEIASELYLSVHTVRNHVARILTKLQAHTRLEAVAVAVRHGLIDFDAS